jgi:hypothetical protein
VQADANGAEVGKNMRGGGGEGTPGWTLGCSTASCVTIPIWAIEALEVVGKVHGANEVDLSDEGEWRRWTAG